MKKGVYNLLLLWCFGLSSYHAIAQTNKGSAEGLHIVYIYKRSALDLPSEMHAYFSAEVNFLQQYKPPRTYTPEEVIGANTQVSEPAEYWKMCVDYLKKQIIYQRTFDDSSKIYAVEPLMNLQWKFTGRKKEILGYPCEEAVITIEEAKKHPLLAYKFNYSVHEYHFWYTTAIPAKDGYLFFTGLPGVVLEVDYSNPDSGKYHRVLVADKIEKVGFPKTACGALTEGVPVASLKEAYYWNFYQKYIGKSKKKKK
ncbi:GLPGLI family protein [Thermonema rossianum]|uniref:GLPGLI family protein n=1 Tax=Thermonema rossianum TaxID=55505 RepID=UPI00146F9980|nr:GLPGLI family protein [Thermonema rossianum]